MTYIKEINDHKTYKEKCDDILINRNTRNNQSTKTFNSKMSEKEVFKSLMETIKKT